MPTIDLSETTVSTPQQLGGVLSTGRQDST